MNEFGQGHWRGCKFLQVDTGSIVVFHDEVDLPPAKVRVKVGGGVAATTVCARYAHIGNEYKRVRIGIGKPDVKELVPMHVLGDFAKSEWAWVEALCDVAADSAALLVEGKDLSFQNRVHLAMEAKGFDDEPDDELSDSEIRILAQR